MPLAVIYCKTSNGKLEMTFDMKLIDCKVAACYIFIGLNIYCFLILGFTSRGILVSH